MKLAATIEPPSATASDPYLSLRDLAKCSSLSIRTIERHLKAVSHPLPHFRVGGRVLVRRSEFDTWLAGYRANPHERVNNIVNDVLRDLGRRRKR